MNEFCFLFFCLPVSLVFILILCIKVHVLKIHKCPKLSLDRYTHVTVAKCTILLQTTVNEVKIQLLLKHRISACFYSIGIGIGYSSFLNYFW